MDAQPQLYFERLGPGKNTKYKSKGEVSVITKHFTEALRLILYEFRIEYKNNFKVLLVKLAIFNTNIHQQAYYSLR